MHYKVTLPDGVTVKEITETDESYLAHLRSKGYLVEKIKELNVCLSCEG